jgi:uncharacterized protein YacL
MLFMRVLLVLFASSSAYLVALQIVSGRFAILGLISGFIIAILAIIFEQRIKKVPLKVVMGGAFGIITGLVVANLLTYPLVLNFFNNRYLEFAAYSFTNCVIGYLGLSIGIKKGAELTILDGDNSSNNGYKGRNNIKILDTSVIIDGRIADICDTGFITAAIMIPQFVLGELQYIADSQDPIRRAKGKRGLNILRRIQEQKDVDVVITDKDFPEIKEVDMRLVALAKEVKARILTNDSNLIKVAELQGVAVSSITQLASALKPLVLPGETMNIMVLKEGKEHGQGVGYLEDGTMVVIDNAKRHLGKEVDIAITSILDTTGGRMIFSKLKEESKKEFSYASIN